MPPAVHALSPKAQAGDTAARAGLGPDAAATGVAEGGRGPRAASTQPPAMQPSATQPPAMQPPAMQPPAMQPPAASGDAAAEIGTGHAADPHAGPASPAKTCTSDDMLSPTGDGTGSGIPQYKPGSFAADGTFQSFEEQRWEFYAQLHMAEASMPATPPPKPGIRPPPPAPAPPPCREEKLAATWAEPTAQASMPEEGCQPQSAGEPRAAQQTSYDRAECRPRRSPHPAPPLTQKKVKSIAWHAKMYGSAKGAPLKASTRHVSSARAQHLALRPRNPTVSFKPLCAGKSPGRENHRRSGALDGAELPPVHSFLPPFPAFAD